jgi:hypothetical protein
LWKPIHEVQHVKVLTANLEVGFCCFEIDISTTGELIYNIQNMACSFSRTIR